MKPLEGHVSATDKDEVVAISAGCLAAARTKRTSQAPGRAASFSRKHGPREPDPNLGCDERFVRCAIVAAKNEHLIVGTPSARETGATADEDAEVGVAHTSCEVGKWMAPKAGGAKARRVECDLEWEIGPLRR